MALPDDVRQYCQAVAAEAEFVRIDHVALENYEVEPVARTRADDPDFILQLNTDQLRIRLVPDPRSSRPDSRASGPSNKACESTAPTHLTNWQRWTHRPSPRTSARTRITH